MFPVFILPGPGSVGLRVVELRDSEVTLTLTTLPGRGPAHGRQPPILQSPRSSVGPPFPSLSPSSSTQVCISLCRSSVFSPITHSHFWEISFALYLTLTFMSRVPASKKKKRKQSLAKDVYVLIGIFSPQPLPLSASPAPPSLHPVPPALHPTPPSGLGFLLTDGRAVGTPSLKQHLIAVFCSWTSKLGLRHCTGVPAARALGERR